MLQNFAFCDDYQGLKHGCTLVFLRLAKCAYFKIIIMHAATAN